MILRQRLSLQLTPLLDLLLIIIFAQFMEVREDQSQLSAKAEQMLQERNVMQTQLLEVSTQAAVLEKEVTRARMQAATAEADAERLARENKLVQEDLDRALAQHRVLGELVVELFQVPQEDVNRVLNPDSQIGRANSPEELERLKEEFRKLAVQQSGHMIEHLLSYEEIRKRCDVWDLYINESGTATLTAGSNSYRIRIPQKIDGEVDEPQLLNELYTLYRSLPQPKGLVIILLTYDRKVSRGITQPVRNVLPKLVGQMQMDRAGSIRFEYADLGFRIE